jgi:hypothetical protein
MFEKSYTNFVIESEAALPKDDAEAAAFSEKMNKFDNFGRLVEFAGPAKLKSYFSRSNVTGFCSEQLSKMKNKKEPLLTPVCFYLSMFYIGILTEDQTRTGINLIIALLIGDDLMLFSDHTGYARAAVYHAFYEKLRSSLFTVAPPPASVKEDDKPLKSSYAWQCAFVMTLVLPDKMRDFLSLQCSSVPSLMRPSEAPLKKKNKRAEIVCLKWLNGKCTDSTHHENGEGQKCLHFCDEASLQKLRKSLPKSVLKKSDEEYEKVYKNSKRP